MARLKGVDVSRWQGLIDWPAVKSSVDFAIIKASGGDDGLYPDGQFQRNKSEARRVGILRGFYHFAGGVLGPEQEADHFVASIGDRQAGEMLVLDWEVPHANPVDWCNRFCKRVEARTGIKPLIYMNGSTVKGHDWKPLIDNNFGLWVANWGNNDTVPDGDPGSGAWPFWALWQYSSNGIVAGINGRVDLDLFNGDASAFLKYGNGTAPATTPPPAPQPAPAPSQPEYTIKSGENLSVIAARYGKTWQELWAINRDRIANPDRIFAGQVIKVFGGATPAPQQRKYTVVAGDNLSKIGSKYGVSWVAIYNANRAIIGPDPNFIKVGQVLVIP